jgi:beta-galactosidase
MHRAVAGYHRMFFERNIAVDIPSARELDPAKLRQYKLVIVPYPILLTQTMAHALEQYAAEGGRLFIEARAGWVDEQGHAQPVLPGFGWHKMAGVRESQVLPASQPRVSWTGKGTFAGMAFEEQFTALAPDAKVAATFADGAPAAYEHAYRKGKVIVLGTFAGEANAVQPVDHHPLGDILADWGGLARPQLTASSFVELRRMKSPRGEIMFLFNHGKDQATVDYTADLPASPRRLTELITGAAIAGNKRLGLSMMIPASSVRVYRIDY